jgi:Ca-activated chloride channel homolog
VLTDGDDYGSKFGARRAIQSAQRLGVPVYVIALTLRNELRGNTVLDLEALTDATGGRLYFATGFEDLTRAYAEINEELRSQYLITFYAPSGTSLEDLRDVDLNVQGRGLEVRSVVGAM